MLEAGVVKWGSGDYVRPMPSYVRPSKQIGLRLAPEMLAWLEAAATSEDRTVAYVIRRLIAAEMAREEAAKKRKAGRTG